MKILINNDLDKLIQAMSIYYTKFNKKKCSKCGIVQGIKHKGFSKYYCEHITKKVDRHFLKIKLKLFQDIMSSVPIGKEKSNGR